MLKSTISVIGAVEKLNMREVEVKRTLIAHTNSNKVVKGRKHNLEQNGERMFKINISHQSEMCEYE